MNELIDITDKIIPETNNFFNDDEALELYQTCLHIMEEFINENISKYKYTLPPTSFSKLMPIDSSIF